MKYKIYKLAPYILKVIFLNIIALKNKKLRNTKGYKNYLTKYINQWYFTNEDLRIVQEDELKKLLIEAYNFIPFYKRSFEKLKITLPDIKENPFEILNKLPLLSKLERRNYVNDIINANPKRPTVEIGYTSGTSGTPTVNYLDQESIDRSFALWSRFHKTIGLERPFKSVRFSGRLIINPMQKKKPFWVYNYFEKQLLMSTYHLKDENIKFYIDKINQFKPKFLDGYPSAFYIISNYAMNNDIEINIKPIAIATTAETLYDYQREVIEKVFKCKIYNQYASSEGSPFITECIYGNLHVNTDSGIFEFLNEKNVQAKKGEIARMVVTSFRNLKTPLIRYDILDNVILDIEKECSCGCKMQTIVNIIGREDDLLWTNEKGYIGRMDTAYKGLEGILQSQIIQINPTDFEIINVIDKNYTKAIERKFLQNLKDRLGSSVKINFIYVDSIPLGKNGKFEAVKRKFKIN